MGNKDENSFVVGEGIGEYSAQAPDNTGALLLCAKRKTKPRKAKKVQQGKREGTPRACVESVLGCVRQRAWGGIVPKKRVSHQKKAVTQRFGDFAVI